MICRASPSMGKVLEVGTGEYCRWHGCARYSGLHLSFNCSEFNLQGISTREDPGLCQVAKEATTQLGWASFRNGSTSLYQAFWHVGLGFRSTAPARASDLQRSGNVARFRDPAAYLRKQCQRIS